MRDHPSVTEHRKLLSEMKTKKKREKRREELIRENPREIRGQKLAERAKSTRPVPGRLVPQLSIPCLLHPIGIVFSCGRQRASTFCAGANCLAHEMLYESREAAMNILNHIKITSRDAQVLKLPVQGCSNKEIAAQLSISPRTVKQPLRTLFLRAGIRDGRKRVKLATAMFQKEQMESCLRATG
jgi:DNA-binding CsgD family transcriptional regulator